MKPLMNIELNKEISNKTEVHQWECNIPVNHWLTFLQSKSTSVMGKFMSNETAKNPLEIKDMIR